MNWAKELLSFLLASAVGVLLYFFVIEPLFGLSRQDVRLLKVVLIAGCALVAYTVERWRKRKSDAKAEEPK